MNSSQKPMTWQKLVKLSFVLATAASAFLIGLPTAAAHDEHHPSGEELLRTTCLDRMNAGDIPFDRSISQLTSRAVIALGEKSQGDDCENYNWVILPGQYTFATFDAYYNGPDINRFDDEQNAWDCNHSSIESAVYAWSSTGFQRISYSNFYGNYENGHCYHDGSGFASVGSQTNMAFETSHIVVAVRSWQHNDPKIGHTGTYCSGINCARPSVLVVDPTLYSHCANERGTCNFPGSLEVQYGASGSYHYGIFIGSTACTNSVFGDPKPGQAKSCAAGHRLFKFCANESSNGSTQCRFSGNKVVAYGARGKFTYGKFNGVVACSNSVFGDPIPGVVKYCFVQN